MLGVAVFPFLEKTMVVAMFVCKAGEQGRKRVVKWLQVVYPDKTRTGFVSHCSAGGLGSSSG